MGYLLDSKREGRKTKSSWGLIRAVPGHGQRMAIREMWKTIGGWRSQLAGRPWIWLLLMVVCGGVLGLLIFTRIGTLFAPFACFGVVLFPVLSVVLGIWGSGPREVALWRALLWHGRCAACASLLPTEIDGEGFCRCVTCGAWWAMTRLRWGRCPGCGYSLGGVPTDAGQRVTCPECGSRWRVPEGARERAAVGAETEAAAETADAAET